MSDQLDEIGAIPDSCLPSADVIDAALRGPAVEPDTGKITDGMFAGMTPAEVEADRRSYESACQGGSKWLRTIIDDIRKGQ
jgi:hypothetical protein